MKLLVKSPHIDQGFGYEGGAKSFNLLGIFLATEAIVGTEKRWVALGTTSTSKLTISDVC